LDIPIKFLLPGQDTVFSHEITSYDKKQLLLNNPGELTDRFSAATPYYKDAQHYESSTLQSADLDFIGLATNKNYYQNGTSVNFIANVKNELDKPNTIYMSMTVPTNLYNPIETSNNSQEAFIQNIVAFYTTTVIYYQTASKATPQDIQAMKDLNVPGKSLDDYYNTVVINNWTLYNVADSLPSDVVMLVARTENIPQGTIVRIDYEVNVKMDINTTNSYINNGAIQYYSSTAQLESRSNTVKIQNYNLNNEILITKSPDHQKVNVTTGTEGIFDIKFTVPMEAESYTNLLFEDQLPKALTLSPSSTIQIGTNAEQPLNASISSTKLVTLLFTNMSQIVGQDIKIKMVTIVDEPINIPLDNIDTNKASLLINSDPTLISLSNSVNVEFSFDDLFNLDKSPELQNYQKISGEKVEFQIYFDVPQDATEITSMVIKDILHPALSYDPLNSILQIGTSLVEALNAIVTNNTVEINLSNIQQAAGQAVRITLGAILSDINALPTDGVVENYAMLTLNNVPAYSFKSNTVTATFGLEINPVQITKAPNVQQVNEEVGEKVTFQLSFAIPENVLGYKEITIIDIIDESLKYDVMNSTI
ncbi:MAG: isopeptide-forming domain-containing fimbrial protein, partial [Anaerorhabdus sp.]